MIIDARNGNTTRGYRAFTDRGELAHFLDAMQIGQEELIEKFIRVDGAENSILDVQLRMGNAKAPGARYRTRTTPDGLLITRLA